MYKRLEALEARLDQFVHDNAKLIQAQQEIVLEKVLEQQLESEEGFEA